MVLQILVAVEAVEVILLVLLKLEVVVQEW
jgi:hypothetical protein